MKRFVLTLQNSTRNWQETAGLTFKKALPTVPAVTLIIFLSQLAGVCFSLYQAAELNWLTDTYDYTTGEAIKAVWGPRLEVLMSKGAWFPLSAAGYLFVLLTAAMTPVRMAGGNKLGNTLRRMPAGGFAPCLGSILSGFSFSLFYWAAELANVLVCALLYRQFVPAEAQLPQPAFLALIRWDVLNGLFPFARPGLLVLMLLAVLTQVISVACIGWDLAEGRNSALRIVVLVVLLIASVFQYHIGLGNPGSFSVSLTAAVCLTADRIRYRLTARKEEP